MKQLFAPLLLLFLLTAHPCAVLAQQKSSWVDGETYDGKTISASLPKDQQFRNIGSKIWPYAGMCVNSSIEMAALYQGLEQMRGYRNWSAQYPGGSYPSKVDAQLEKWWKYKNITPIPYLQYEGKEPEELLKMIFKTSRMACVTYGHSPRYIDGRNPRGLIAHMVNGVLYEEKYGVILDNNFINSYEWMLGPEFIRRLRLQPNGANGSAWVFVWLTPGAPPAPKGKK